jgi:DNA polymerase-3 subunit gamma/tau
VSSQALARQWRPKNFASIVGQEHVVKGLQYALAHNRLHHAYLFTGTRGVGKTTLARIFAKCLSCENGVTPDPCGQCSACLQIDQGSFFDLIEIDAASRTKVEDTRDLLDNVQYAPTVGRFKIYLIDEVHMLSTHSFNALLKTLEEPPSHVKFLLATTDPQKLPITVLSRCLQYHLRALTMPQLTGHLSQIISQEGFSFEPEALSVIALSAKGSARDALSLLDQAIAFTGGDIRTDLVCRMLGVVPQELVYQLAEAISLGDANKGMHSVDLLRESWIDVEGLLLELARFWQEVAVAQVIDLELSEYFDLKKVKLIAASTDPVKVQLFYQVCLTMQSELSLAPDPFSGFQMAILRMLAFSKLEAVLPFSDENKQNNQKIESPESEGSRSFSLFRSQNQNLHSQAQEIKLIRKEGSPARDSNVNENIQNLKINSDGETQKNEEKVLKTPGKLKVLKEDLKNNWKNFVEQLAIEGIVRQVATHTKFERMNEKLNGNESVLSIFLLVEKSVEGLLSERIIHRLAGAIELGLGHKVSLVINPSGTANLETPAKQMETELIEQEALAHEMIVSDVYVQELQDAFGAKIDTKTVQLIGKK